MTNPIVQGIHEAQGRFIRTAVDLSGYALDWAGCGIEYASIAIASTGLGAEAGAVLYALGNGMRLMGTGIQTITDLSDKNYEDASKKIISTAMFRGFSKIGALAKLTKGQQYIWDYIINPFEDTFNFMVE